MKNEKTYLEVINNLRDGVYFVDTEQRFTFWNKAAEDITGFKSEEILGRHCRDSRLQHISAEGKLICVFGCPIHASLNDGKQYRHEVFVRHKNGYRIPIIVNTFPIWEDAKIIGAIEIFTPHSPNVYEEELIEKLSDHATKDRLTKLPNRGSTESYLEYRLGELRQFGSKFCVFFLDIDNFRVFNNTYGHDLGDEVLITVSKSILHTIRKQDIFGRWGGEEFIGIYEIQKNSDAVMIAESIRILIENSEVEHKGEALSVTASLGVTEALESDTVDSVVKRADSLMYQSKQNGKNRVTSDVKC